MRNRKERTTAERSKRIPLGVLRQKLNLAPETQKWLDSEGKVARWINDKDSRVNDAIAGGYEFVMEQRVPVESGDAKEMQKEDRKVRKYVGKNSDGSPMYAYLMAIKKDWFEEDQQAKEAVNRRVDEAIRSANPPGLEHHGIGSEQGSTYAKKIDYSP